jgi:uncharacterized protein
MANKPSHEEEEYFAKEEANRLHALAAEKSRELEATERERLKQLHFMKCPKCGFDLQTIQFKGLNIDRCFHCGGTWLDTGELEALAGKESDFLHKVVGIFRRK